MREHKNLIVNLKLLILFSTISVLSSHVGKAQSTPYLFPKEITNIDFPSEVKSQIQSFYWFNLGEYEKAKEYHEQSLGTKKVLSNEAFERFSKLIKVDARSAILEAFANEQILMFNSAHHTSTAYIFLRQLLPQLSSQGYSTIAIEAFPEERITDDGLLKVKGTG